LRVTSCVLRVACYVVRVAGCVFRGVRCGSFDLGYGIADFGLARRRTKALEFGIGNAEIGMKGIWGEGVRRSAKGNGKAEVGMGKVE